MGTAGRKIIYANCNGQEFDGHLMGGTPAGAHLLVDIDGSPVILRRVPWMGDTHPGGECWRYAALHDALDADTPVVVRTGEWPAVFERADDCGEHEYPDGERVKI